jgi:hypothetical protein
MINRVRVVWSGWQGAPGLSTFHFDGTGTPPLAAVSTFFNAIKTQIPSSVKFDIQNTGQTIDPVTGALVGSWSGPAQTQIAASGVGSSMVAQGAQVAWKSDTIHGSRFLAGRSFFIPLTHSGLNADGTLTSACISVFQNAANALVAGGLLVLWGRPREATPKLPALAGSQGLVRSATVPATVAVLRSRRT